MGLGRLIFRCELLVYQGVRYFISMYHMHEWIITRLFGESSQDSDTWLITSWWLNHPFEKYASQIGSFPQGLG